jgi:uncharacterized membrane protein
MTLPADETLRIERLLGRVLTVGTWVSTACLAAGLILVLIVPNERLAGVLLTAGLLVLMATPVARVAVSVAEFARQREWWFVLYTVVVLMLLLGSITVAVLG